MGSMVTRAQIVIKGIVQGVGFRPYIFNLAESLDLKGFVTNTSEGVFIDVEGTRLAEFVEKIRNEAPPLSHITDIAVKSLPVHGYSEFTIQQSLNHMQGLSFTLVSPDISICPDCLQELINPADRRYLYPFINCTNCGPRYSITRSIPYDRPNTTMADFTMCASCLKEYEEPRNRRFHAQPNACAVCGPRVEYKVQNPAFGINESASAIQKAVQVLLQGGIVAVKGIGGFHIACDALNDSAVRRLRNRKRRNNKPFAVMSPDINRIEKFCLLSQSEREVVLSNRRPIVLLGKRNNCPLPDAISPNNRDVGFMLPYAPLHYLLFHHPLDEKTTLADHFDALVMTSGNISEEPIIHDNAEAVAKLGDVVDGFLLHNRDIFMRVDDSVVRVFSTEPGSRSLEHELFYIRRSRGYAPDPIMLHDEGPEVLGCGADLKNTFTLTKGRFAIPSQHIGDMENYETVKFFETILTNLKSVYRAAPEAIVHDLHPEYLSSRWAKEYGGNFTWLGPETKPRTFAVQHHYAHIGSVMAEHGLVRKIIGVAFDGTGYGTDGHLWGGEFIIAGIDGFQRVGHLKYIPLPGGEAAIREPWKTAVSFIMNTRSIDAVTLLKKAGFMEKYGRKNIDNIRIIARSRDFSPLSSGAGRLFDAVSALIGICDRNTFEGEAAMALEACVHEGIAGEYPIEFSWENGYTTVDFSPAVLAIIDELCKDPKEVIASKFHNTVSTVILTMAKQIAKNSGISDIALSGGTFQNRYLMKSVFRRLSTEGFNVYLNTKVPCNDACISLGQAYLVRERLKRDRAWQGEPAI
jgi:hydrogenase maturation protein HypF